MIELNYTGICAGCEFSDLKVECIRWGGWHNGNPITLKKWEVVCEHMESCERWAKDFERWQKEAEAKEAPVEEKPEETDEYRTLAAEAERIKKAVLDVFSKRMNGNMCGRKLEGAE